ncbi:MAG: hypothetical protein ACOC22_02845 [bacterium]
MIIEYVEKTYRVIKFYKGDGILCPDLEKGKIFEPDRKRICCNGGCEIFDFCRGVFEQYCLNKLYEKSVIKENNKNEYFLVEYGVS